MEVYVVTNPELGWDCVVDICTNIDFANQKYGTTHVIHAKTLNEGVYKEVLQSDLKKNGRGDYNYNLHEAEYVHSLGDFNCEVKIGLGKNIINTIIDPIEGSFTIEIDGEEAPHTLETFSLIADLFCETTKISRDTILIFRDDEWGLFLGSIDKYEDSSELWDSFEKNNVKLYY